MQKIKISRKQVGELESLNDRYVIYGMMEQKICFQNDSDKVEGIVERVIRSVFDDTVSLWVKSKEYKFNEPQLMYRDGDFVVFVYGDLDKAELDDEELFKEARGIGYYGETMNDVLRRTEKGGITEQRFKIIGSVDKEHQQQPDKTVKERDKN